MSISAYLAYNFTCTCVSDTGLLLTSQTLVGIGFSAYVASLAEIQLGIICACAPSLKAVFHKFFQQALPAIGTVLSSRGSGSRRIMRKKSRKFDESIDSTQINLTGHPGGGEDNLGHHTMIVATQVPHSRPKTALSEVKAKMKKWPKRTPEIHETTSFSMAHEDAVVPSDRGGPSPIPEGYQFTRPAASVLSPSRPASDHSFATFHRWEKGDHEKPLPSTPPDTLSEHSADRETIWVGRAV